MVESDSIDLARAIQNGRTSVPDREHPFPDFLVSVRAMWPRKTAAHLGAAAGVTERAAKFWLSGDRDPSPEAFRVVFNKIATRRK